MSDTQRPGTIGWHDLTVENADQIRDFYAAVAQWKPEPVDMGGYSDFSMVASDGSPTAGVCFKRGTNADIPSQWLMYIIVEDIDASIAACTKLGGSVLVGPKSMGSARYCVIRDPAGAVCGLYQA
ncbi:MAG: VOC family protein [Phycisphaeraceae bacterium]|nr:VOC family protein [Phycisphaerales bacterium]MCB9860384.1 VOC family protein [Phycisphaeraceae bacterium]